MIKEQAKAFIPTEFGDFEMYAFSESPDTRIPEIVLKTPDLPLNKDVNLRIHSECITGDVFHSRRCDCGDQLIASLQYIHRKGGMLIYHRQEGRNIGIIEKLKAYNLQDEGLDTAQANKALGHQADARNYKSVLEILSQIGVHKVKLLTNNPEKIKAFEGSTIEVVERIPLEIQPNAYNQKYLQTKKDIFGHYLNLK